MAEIGIGHASFHCVCGEEFTLAHGTATTEQLVAHVTRKWELHKKECEHWMTQRAYSQQYLRAAPVAAEGTPVDNLD